MSETGRADAPEHDDNTEPSADPPESDLDRGLDGLFKATEGVAARLFGPRLVGRETIGPTPAISKEADEALSNAGEAVGRLLNAAGTAMRDHPLDPGEAVKTATQRVEEPVPESPGWSPLSTGMASFGSGLLKVAEGVLDQVAPRKAGKKPAHAADADSGAVADDSPDDTGGGTGSA
jgi:hypothetical protein